VAKQSRTIRGVARSRVVWRSFRTGPVEHSPPLARQSSRTYVLTLFALPSKNPHASLQRHLVLGNRLTFGTFLILVGDWHPLMFYYHPSGAAGLRRHQDLQYRSFLRPVFAHLHRWVRACHGLPVSRTCSRSFTRRPIPPASSLGDGIVLLLIRCSSVTPGYFLPWDQLEFWRSRWFEYCIRGAGDRQQSSPS